MIAHSGWFAHRGLHRDGAELVFCVQGRGDWLGMADFLHGGPSGAEIVACHDAEVLSVPRRKAIDRWLAPFDLRPALERELATEVVRLRRAMLSLAFSSLDRRVAAFLLEIERVVTRTPGLVLHQSTIAEAVGATRPKVNRCLKMLECRGLVTLRRGEGVRVRHRDGLAVLA